MAIVEVLDVWLAIAFRLLHLATAALVEAVAHTCEGRSEHWYTFCAGVRDEVHRGEVHAQQTSLFPVSLPRLALLQARVLCLQARVVQPSAALFQRQGCQADASARPVALLGMLLLWPTSC